VKRIKDERLILLTLKNIRIAFILQTLGILAIFIGMIITSGPVRAFDSPLFLVMIIPTTVLSWLQLRVSADIESTSQKAKRHIPYYGWVLISCAIGLIFGYAIYLTDPRHPGNAFILGLIFFICLLAVYSANYYLRKKRDKDND
jgi:hypothetical protein